MATYAAYRHIELDKIGYGKKRVLKPPGGGSSDIFGSDSTDSRPRARNGRAMEASIGSVFQQSDAPSTTPSKARVDSHSRLFGPPPESQATPSKNRMKSNIPIGEVVVNGHGNGHTNGHVENGHTNGDTSALFLRVPYGARIFQGISFLRRQALGSPIKAIFR